MARKDKGEGELEHLRGVVRSQKALIKNLRKTIARYEKRTNQFETYLEDAEEEEVEKDNAASYQKKKCIKCLKGDIVISDLGIRKIITCSVCDHREVQKT